MTLGKDGGRLSRLDSSGSNKTVWNKHSCKRCRMFVRSTVRCTEHPDDPGSVQVLPKLTRQGLLRAWQLGNTAEWQRKVMNSSFLWRITRQTAPMVPPELFSLQDQKAGWTSSLKCVWNLLLLTVGQKNVCCYIPMESLRFPVKSTKLLSPYGKGRSLGRAKP